MSAAALQDVQSTPLALIGSARAGRRTLLDMLLSAKGYEIAIREDGPAVLEFLKENQPAIAIFDHDLPGMDGREICSRMRFITRLAETPVAIVTPPVEEMGGLNEFENFTDTTTADIVEAEPLGKKKLVERLENVIRDQKGAANDGKMTIAIPSIAPRISEFKAATTADKGNDLDVFVDDDVDIEVDVARAIYSNEAGFEQRAEQEPEVAEPVAANGSASDHAQVAAGGAEVQVSEGAAQTEFMAEEAAEAVVPAEEKVVADANAPMPTGADETAARTDAPAAEYGEDMFLSDQVDAGAEEVSDSNDIDLFAEEGDSMKEPTSEVEADWPDALVADAVEAEPVEAEPFERAVELVSNSTAADGSEEDDLTATIEAAIEAVNLAAMEEAEIRAAEAAAQENLDGEAASEFALATDSAEPVELAAVTDEGEIDVKATVEMVVENAQTLGANDAELEPSGAVSPHSDELEADPAVLLPEVAEPFHQETLVMPEIAAQAAELERLETLDASANKYADGGQEIRLESPSAEADGLEEGDPAVSSGEQYNMQALIAEQAERIDNLQERNVLLRQELEQLKADEALRHAERSNLQALIKEQTEAITNLQQRNVQLRQELEQFRAEESKRESERTFLQSHTSEQAETIAKLQQLNALLRQELEQRKADEAPLRDFLQRLLDRDEESSAYQEAMRKEIISLTRENS